MTDFTGVFDRFKLTEKEKSFCSEFMLDRNAPAAAIRAGYASRGAAKAIMERKSIRDCLEALEEAERKNKIAGCDEICSFLTSVMRGEEIEPSARWVDGELQVSGVQVGTRERMRAAELLGKKLNIFGDKGESGLGGVLFEGEEDIKE